jgi:hypothetical protein
MADKKSKLPDLNELGSMAGKLFKDIKNSVTDIVKDYKEKREVGEEEKAKAPETPAAPKAKPAAPKAKPAEPTKAEPKAEKPVEQKPVPMPEAKPETGETKDKE